MNEERHPLNNLRRLRERRRELRREATPAEVVLWQMLRGKSTGYKFRRQHSVGNYILDFYCPAARLAIELDGEVHNSATADEYDLSRTRYLSTVAGIRVLRFENRDVFDQPEGVMQAILDALAESGAQPVQDKEKDYP